MAAPIARVPAERDRLGPEAGVRIKGMTRAKVELHARRARRKDRW
jgi:hypothetical protein